MNTSLKAVAANLSLNIDDIKKGYQQLSPLIHMIAKRTPNQYDDAFVAVLDVVFADSPEGAVAANEETLAATADRLGLNVDDIKKGYARLSPIIHLVVKLTPNKFDDAAVLVIDALFASTGTAAS